MWKSRWPSWVPRPNEPCGFCGRKATLNHVSALVTIYPWYVNRHPRTLSSTSSSSLPKKEKRKTDNDDQRNENADAAYYVRETIQSLFCALLGKTIQMLKKSNQSNSIYLCQYRLCKRVTVSYVYIWKSKVCVCEINRCNWCKCVC